MAGSGSYARAMLELLCSLVRIRLVQEVGQNSTRAIGQQRATASHISQG